MRRRARRAGRCSLSFMKRLSGIGGEFAREEVAQHVGDGGPAPESGDLDATAQCRRDVDRQPGGEGGGLVAATARGSGALIQLSAFAAGPGAKPRRAPTPLMARSSRLQRRALRSRAPRRSAPASSKHGRQLRRIGRRRPLATVLEARADRARRAFQPSRGWMTARAAAISTKRAASCGR